MINDALKSFLQSKIDSADKAIPKFVLEELKQKVLNSPTKFSKSDIEALFNNLEQRYSESKENSLLGKVDSLFKEISNVEKLLSSIQFLDEEHGDNVVLYCGFHLVFLDWCYYSSHLGELDHLFLDRC